METRTETTEAKYGRESGDEAHDVSVPLEVLFSSPIILKSNKAIQFLAKCHDDTKEDSNMKDFKINVNENALKCKIWPADKTWEDVIDQNEESSSEKKHCKLLRTFMNKDGTPRKKLLDVDPNSVTDLLGVIRNKYSHKGSLGEDVLKILGWGKEIWNQYEFCDEKFLAYWTVRFPKLLPFLWEQYKEPMSVKNPGGAYPPFFKSQYSSCCLLDNEEKEGGKTWRLGGQLENTLSQNLEQGWLEDRFTFGKAGSFTLEFRTLKTCYLDVDKHNFLEIEFPGIGEERVIRTWYEILNDKITVSDNNTISLAYEKEDSSRESFLGRILVCNKLSELIDYFSKDRCINLFKSSAKLIIFSNREHISEQKAKTIIVKKFVEALRMEYCNRPVSWSDLENITQNTLAKQVDIKIQDAYIKFEDFLKDAKNNGTLDKILLNLQGRDLNEMLKTKTIVISTLDTNIKPPTSEKTYISRKVYSRGNVSSNFFENQATTSQYRNRFIILQSGEHKIPDNQNLKFTKVRSLNEFQNININDSESTLFYVEEPIQNFSKVSINFKCSVKKNVNVHIFECLEVDRFEWVTTMHGSFTEINESLYMEAEIGASDQEAVLNKNFKSKIRSGGIIFISDGPGMGKTELLMNLAGKMRHRESTCILFFEMQNILENVGKIVSKDQIINTITDLSCSDGFGKKIMRHLLNSNTLGIKLEIMIDGLDEVNTEHKNLAYEVLKLIQREFPWLRVWLTGRDYLLEEVREQLGVLGCKFPPFTRTEQISYLKIFWRESWDNSGKKGSSPNDTRLEVFANSLLSKCISLEGAHLAGIPLQCKMIAEVFEEKVLNDDLSLDDTSGFGLHAMYDQMLKKTFRIYWREKQKLSVPTDHHVAKRERQRIDNFLVYLSIKLIFSEEKANELKSYLEIPRRKQDLEILKLDVLKHGIIQSLSPLRFIHRTFAEYIVAWFVTQEVEECLESNEFLDSIEGVVKDFILNDVLAIEGTIYSQSFHHNCVTLFLNTKSESVLSNASDIFREQEITPAYCKLVKISENLIRDGMHVLCDASSISIHTRLHDTAYKEGHKYILLFSILFSENALNSFMFALNNHFSEVAKFIADEMNFGPELWHKVREFDETKSGVLHRSFNFFNSWEISWLFEYAFEQKRSLFEERDSKGQTPFMAAINYALRLPSDVDLGYLKMVSANTVLNEMEIIKSLEGPICPIESVFLLHKIFIGKLVKFGVDINKTDNDGNTAIHLIFSYPICSNESGEHSLNWYINFAKFFLPETYNWAHLNKFNKVGNTPLLCFLDNYNSCFENNYELAFQRRSVLHKMFCILKKIGMYFNARDRKADETILHKAIQRKYHPIFIELLVIQGANVLDKNRKGQCAVHLAVECQHFPVIRYLIQMTPNY